MANIHLVGLVGSIREQSYNKMLMRAAGEVLPDDVELEMVPIDQLPFYNQDLEGSAVPFVVQEFRKRIERADGLLIATPEYNYSISGVLKNAIEWASRPVTNPALAGKPVALLGASAGAFGTVRAQLALRQILAGTGNQVISRPEVLVGMAQNKFDASGRLVDPQTVAFLRQSLMNFLDHLRANAPIGQAS